MHAIYDDRQKFCPSYLFIWGLDATDAPGDVMKRDITRSREIEKTHVLSEEEKQERKHLVLSQARPSITRGIADAVVIKSANIFFLAQPDGNIPLGDSHGYGLYYHDCRFLNGYELTLADASLHALVSATPAGNVAIFELTNPELQVREGEQIKSEESSLIFLYHGADHHYRSLAIRFSMAPSEKDQTTVQFDITLGPRETKDFSVSLAVSSRRWP